MVKTYNVVSWLMFAKEEFVKVLILLLLRSLRRKQTRTQHNWPFALNITYFLESTTFEKYLISNEERNDWRIERGIRNTYTSCRYLKVASSFGTTLNWLPSRYLQREAVTVKCYFSSHIVSEKISLSSRTKDSQRVRHPQCVIIGRFFGNWCLACAEEKQ